MWLDCKQFSINSFIWNNFKYTGNRDFTTEDLLLVITETNEDELPKDDDETEKSSSEIGNKYFKLNIYPYVIILFNFRLVPSAVVKYMCFSISY